MCVNFICIIIRVTCFKLRFYSADITSLLLLNWKKCTSAIVVASILLITSQIAKKMLAENLTARNHFKEFNLKDDEFS